MEKPVVIIIPESKEKESKSPSMKSLDGSINAKDPPIIPSESEPEPPAKPIKSPESMMDLPPPSIPSEDGKSPANPIPPESKSPMMSSNAKTLR